MAFYKFYLGIDVSKATLDVALLEPGQAKARQRVFRNTPRSHQQLLAGLHNRKVNPVHVCLKSSGTYGEAVALVLHKSGHTVSIVNPALVCACGQSELSRTKTNKADAQLIARFCRVHQPPACMPLALELSELQALVRRMEALEQMGRWKRTSFKPASKVPPCTIKCRNILPTSKAKSKQCGR
jgi:transposase